MIDWNKPIRIKTHGQWTSGVPKLEYLGLNSYGQHRVAAKKDYIYREALYLFDDKGLSVEDANGDKASWTIENVPPPERWVNVFWDKENNKVTQGVIHKTEADAKSCTSVTQAQIPSVRIMQQYLGTFKLED